MIVTEEVMGTPLFEEGISVVPHQYVRPSATPDHVTIYRVVLPIIYLFEKTIERIVKHAGVGL